MLCKSKSSAKQVLQVNEKFVTQKVSLLDSRAKLIGSALATAGYEGFVTPDGRPTISDAFDLCRSLGPVTQRK